MPISENAKAVLERRYLARDEQGQPTETVDGLFRRVANAVAEGDRRFDSKADVVATAKEFYELMVSLDFLPNSPPHERGPPPGPALRLLRAAGGRLHGGHLRRH